MKNIPAPLPIDISEGVIIMSYINRKNALDLFWEDEKYKNLFSGRPKQYDICHKQ